MDNKKSGILLHPTALPGSYGIGNIGSSAYRFIDNLSDMGQNLWQILPIGPTDIFNSPYSSTSTFAGNHMLISLNSLVNDELLDKKYLIHDISFDENRVDFKLVQEYKLSILKEVCKNFMNKASDVIKDSFQKFCIEQSYWLDEYAMYCGLKKENDKTSWPHWKKIELQNKESINEAKIMQFLFHYQWKQLRVYCNSKGIKIIGDMPIYVGHDSADVFFNKELFELDDCGNMLWQSGVPPCAFQENGQLWGSPIYNWENHEKDKFKWWKRRFKKLFEMVDIIRLDHFIGYSKYYRIPIGDKTAKNGKWITVPGNKLFEELVSTIPEFDVIVEDLGNVTEDVIKLREKFNFSGMRILQFELNNISFKENLFKNSVVCTGTHDNHTLLGWFYSLPEKSKDKTILTKKKLLNFFNCKKENIHWEILDFAFSTNSKMVIIPLQDILGDGADSRFNEPGTISDNNWSWRMKNEKLTDLIKNKLFELTKKYKK